jgi:hypothetical protein
MPPGISETIKTAVIPNESPGIEGVKVKGLIVKCPSGLRISRQQDLETTVK